VDNSLAEIAQLERGCDRANLVGLLDDSHCRRGALDIDEVNLPALSSELIEHCGRHRFTLDSYSSAAVKTPEATGQLCDQVVAPSEGAVDRITEKAFALHFRRNRIRSLHVGKEKKRGIAAEQKTNGEQWSERRRTGLDGRDITGQVLNVGGGCQ
jgi:hypothetical protein